MNGKCCAGFFITFEGIDGSGKSTQARQLAETLGARLTREPGGSPGAEQIRRLLVEGEAGRWSAETEILLFTAARRDHLEKTILPALEAGGVIVSDRFADSTRIYQGVARATLRDTVDRLHALMIAQEPDLTFVIDTDPKVALERGLGRGSGEDRFESFGVDFQERLRAGFLALAEEYPDRVRVIDGNRAPTAIAAEVAALARDALARRDHG
ncbi:dTMP kinase [Pararhodobacter sp. SW119]|uniref:dTMP kinase n=1 Tax=Pararhodobacter sp. SW119 TaxID=2780075 RepID=UPI001ADF49D6